MKTGKLPLAIALLVVALGCAEIRDGRVLLIGIDGASWRVAGPLLAAGRLPGLQAIADAGVSGSLRSAVPLSSPRIWNTIATGKTPEKHGIESFAWPDEEGELRLLDSRDRKVHALWNIASDAGRSVAVVNFWNTYPPEPIAGVMVSDHFLPWEIDNRRKLARAAGEQRSGAIVHPPEWRERLQALIETPDMVVATDDPFEALADLAPSVDTGELSQRFADDGLIARVAVEIEAEERPDLMLVLLTGIDRVSHALWAGIEDPKRYPSHKQWTQSERRAAADGLFDYYAYTDALIRRLLEGYGPDDLVVIVSDHGFESGADSPGLTGRHRTVNARDGVLFARGPGIEPGSRASDVGIEDLTPTLLAWMQIPVADDMDGDVASFLPMDDVARVATYETKPVERLPATPSGADEEMLDQLRALGYLESNAADGD